VQLSHPEKDALISALTARLALADAHIAAQDARIAAQDARIAALEARLSELTRPPKTPGNSSKPPSQGQKPDLAVPATDRPEVTNWPPGTHKRTKLERSGPTPQTDQSVMLLWLSGDARQVMTSNT
jgi:hypothetical protein